MHITKRFYLCVVTACLLFSASLLWPLEGAALTGSASASRGFKSKVSRAMASAAASVEARHAAVNILVREFGMLDEVRLFLSGEVMRSAPRPDPLALVWLMLGEEESQSSVSGVPPDMQVHITLKIELDLGDNRAARLAGLLPRHELLNMYSRALELERSALAAYDKAAVYFLRPGPSGKVDKAAAARAAGELERAYAALDAAVAYLGLLPSLYPAGKGVPHNSGKDLIPVVERLAAMSPDNYLILAELARMRLLQGSAREALRLIEKVLDLRADFAQGYDLRGLCQLWLEFPSLALADFSRAIRLEPYHPVFFENRALARRVLEDIPGMCADLAESCSLGECGALDWALSQGYCKP